MAAPQDPSLFEKNNSDLKILIFLSKDCPCSKSHREHLNQLQTQFPQFSFFGVVADAVTPSNSKDIQSYFSSENFQFPIIFDSQKKLIKDFSALKTPHGVILQKQPGGKYSQIYEGGISDAHQFTESKNHFLEENLKAIVANQPLPYNHGKSLGCYIRRF